MAKQAREVGLVYDLPHLLQGEQWGPVSCAKASQEEVAEDLYSVCVCVCVCVCVSINKFLAAAFLHSLPFVHHITQKQITSTLGEKSKKRKVSRWSTVDR
jgi:hypothetical protein